MGGKESDDLSTINKRKQFLLFQRFSTTTKEIKSKKIKTRRKKFQKGFSKTKNFFIKKVNHRTLKIRDTQVESMECFLFSKRDSFEEYFLEFEEFVVFFLESLKKKNVSDSHWAIKKYYRLRRCIDLVIIIIMLEVGCRPRCRSFVDYTVKHFLKIFNTKLFAFILLAFFSAQTKQI